MGGRILVMRWVSLFLLGVVLSCGGESAEISPEPTRPGPEETVGQIAQQIVSGTETRPCDVAIGTVTNLGETELSAVARYAIFSVPELTRDRAVSILYEVTLTGFNSDPCSGVDAQSPCVTEQVGELPPLAGFLVGGGIAANGDVYVSCGPLEPPASGTATIWYKYLL